MNIFENVNRIANIILYIILGTAGVVALGLFYYTRLRKNRRKKLKVVDYSSFDRQDSEEYIKFVDDIKDDMVIVENWTRFIGAVNCQGFDFYSAHPTEQGSTLQNYLGFINTITKPITYRQSSKSVDMEYTMEKYQAAYKSLIDKHDKEVTKLKEMQNIVKANANMSEDKQKIYQDEMRETERQIKAYENRLLHMEDEIRYIDEFSGVDAAPIATNYYIFDWTYNPMEFPVDLTESEIEHRARAELEAIASAKIHALSASGVKARRCSTSELIDMFRRHSAPISAERFLQRYVDRSSYYDDIVTSDSPQRMKNYVRESLDAEAAIALESAFTSDLPQKNEDINLFVSTEKNEGE